jgi:hypothetical protein
MYGIRTQFDGVKSSGEHSHKQAIKEFEEIPGVVNVENRTPQGSIMKDLLINVGISRGTDILIEDIEEIAEKLKKNGEKISEEMNKVIEKPNELNLKNWVEKEIQKIIKKEVGEGAILEMHSFQILEEIPTRN